MPRNKRSSGAPPAPTRSCFLQLGALQGHSPRQKMSPCPHGRKGPSAFFPPSCPASTAPQPEGAAGEGGGPPSAALTCDLPTDTCPALRRGGMNSLKRFSFSMAATKGTGKEGRRGQLPAAAEGEAPRAGRGAAPQEPGDGAPWRSCLGAPASGTARPGRAMAAGPEGGVLKLLF